MPRVHVLTQRKVGAVLTGVFSGLHLTVYHPSILTLPIHMVYFSQEGRVLEKEEQLKLGHLQANDRLVKF